jgi:hypothetical protein
MSAACCNSSRAVGMDPTELYPSLARSLPNFIFLRRGMRCGANGREMADKLQNACSFSSRRSKTDSRRHRAEERRKPSAARLRLILDTWRTHKRGTNGTEMQGLRQREEIVNKKKNGRRIGAVQPSKQRQQGHGPVGIRLATEHSNFLPETQSSKPRTKSWPLRWFRKSSVFCHRRSARASLYAIAAVRLVAWLWPIIHRHHGFPVALGGHLVGIWWEFGPAKTVRQQGTGKAPEMMLDDDGRKVR